MLTAALDFLDETAGLTPEDSVTRNPHYSVIFHEMLAKAIPVHGTSELGNATILRPSGDPS